MNGIATDPVFLAPVAPLAGNTPNTNGTYRLAATSPCLDTGDNTAVTESFDIRGPGFARKLNKATGDPGVVDMGAYEDWHASAEPPAAPCFIDIHPIPSGSMVIGINTTPLLLLTLQFCPDLILTNWTTLATATPVTSPWTYTDTTATNASIRFYKAIVTP
jgi:hypothetical protein